MPEALLAAETPELLLVNGRGRMEVHQLKDEKHHLDHPPRPR
ncbi:hypothetical protein [Streptomyces sp. NPDC021212]